MKKLIAALSIALVAACSPAYADDVRLELGQVAVGSNSGAIGTATRLTLGAKDFPVYLYGDAELGREHHILGQETAVSDLFTFGVGVEHNITQDFTVFGEIGYGTMKTEVHDYARYETPYTVLVGNHAVGNRSIPVDDSQPYQSAPNEPQSFTSVLEYGENPIVFRFGASFQVIEHVKIIGSYRYGKVEEYLAIYDEERRANGTGYWEETRQVDLGAVELGIMLTW